MRFPETHWLGQLFWSCSLWLSIGALISSVSQRLLEQLPATRDVVWEDDRLEDVLSRLMFIGKTVSTSAGTTTQNQTPPSTLPISNTTTRTTTEYFNHPTMIWVWQCPTMLMSFSWLFFILGLWLHLLSPVINGHESLVRRNVCKTPTCLKRLYVADTLNDRLLLRDQPLVWLSCSTTSSFLTGRKLP